MTRAHLHVTMGKEDDEDPVFDDGTQTPSVHSGLRGACQSA
jgi:hypothetical protein